MNAPLRLIDPLTPCEIFCGRRQDMLRAWQALIEAQDIPPEYLREEIDSTRNAMNGLLGLLGCG